MRPLTESDKILIKAIQSLKSGIPIATADLLEKIYFKEVNGRALIIQTVDHYAVLYLKNNLYNSDTTKQKEIIHFDALLSLLKYLENEGFIRVITSGRRHPLSMYFVQDQFNNPQPGNGHIVLNDAEDYTDTPEHIKNRSEDIVYQGVFFNSDYEFLVRILNGSIYIADHFNQLINKTTPENEKPKVTKPKKLRTNRFKNFLKKMSVELKKCAVMITPFLITLLLGLGLYYVWNQNKLQEIKLNELKAETSIRLTSLRDSFMRRLSERTRVQEQVLKIEDNSSKENSRKYYGIDISHYDENIVDKLQLSDSISFVICKATEGIHYQDPYFASNWRTLKKRKIIRGAYHFFKTNSNPIAQANHFVKTVKKWEETDITPIADIEEESLSTIKKQSVKNIQNNLQKFLDVVEKQTGRIPMIYTSTNFATKYLNNPKFVRYPLWIAHYTSRKQPRLPKVWRTKGYKIWQKSDKYFIHSKAEDLDVYFGKLSDIYK